MGVVVLTVVLGLVAAGKTVAAVLVFAAVVVADRLLTVVVTDELLLSWLLALITLAPTIANTGAAITVPATMAVLENCLPERAPCLVGWFG